VITLVPEGELRLPEFYETVKALDQAVPVDYIIPGCPPEPHQIWAVLKAVISGADLPKPGGTIIGAGTVAVCEECPLAKNVKQIKRFYRPYELVPEPGLCLLEQGLLCMGPATRSGCGALCPQVGMRCEGCYGPLDGQDHGARILSAVASVIDVGKAGDDEHAIEEAIDAALDTLADPAGTFYRFSMAHSLLQRAKRD
jgi:F420-non-reducing hydrogenase small subunit